MHILNEDSEPHRFRFIPISESAWSLSNGDPTFMEHSDGSLTFCLAPAEIIEVPWDIEYVLNGETTRAFTGDPIPPDYANNGFGGHYDNATSLILNDTITSVEMGAFSYWTSATSLTLSNNLTHIGDYTFDNWISAPTLAIPSSVTHIGNSAFYGWSSATSLTIPEGVVSIGEIAFQNWSIANSVVIPSTVTSIGFMAFQGWGSATSITCLAVSPPIIAGSVFNNSNNAPIYVPSTSVDEYKSAAGWSTYASRIFAIP